MRSIFEMASYPELSEGSIKKLHNYVTASRLLFMSNIIINEVGNGVHEITLNRPDVLNSFNEEMSSELLSALENAKKVKARAILLTGAGRAFCAGQDLAAVMPKAGEVPDLGAIVKKCYNPIILSLRSLELPVVCAVNGVAAGAGANLAFACDIVLASTKAAFMQSFSNVGLIPDSGGTFHLPRLVGHARTISLTMLGEKLTADEAVRIGLIYKAIEPEQLLGEAQKLTAYLATRPTLGLALTKKAINETWNNSLEQQLKIEEDFQRQAGRSHDYKEGVQAFLEKREAKFQGK